MILYLFFLYSPKSVQCAAAENRNRIRHFYEQSSERITINMKRFVAQPSVNGKIEATERAIEMERDRKCHCKVTKRQAKKKNK